MTTWQNFNANNGAAVTTWNYDQYRGWLNSKAYADNTGPTYTYTAAGRLQTRTWARNVQTTYGFDNAGNQQTITYSDGTASVLKSYDRRGRLKTVTEGSGANEATYAYNDASQVLTETYTAGPLNGTAITNTYDSYLRRTGVVMASSQTGYWYDSGSCRLSAVTDGTNSATYAYLANSDLIDNITFKQNGATRMTRQNSYDFLNRLTSVVSSGGGSNLSAFAYQYNSANQRRAL